MGVGVVDGCVQVLVDQFVQCFCVCVLDFVVGCGVGDIIVYVEVDEFIVQVVLFVV